MIAGITGIRGQDGSYLAKLLLEKGYTVIGLDRRSGNGEHYNWRHRELGIDNKFKIEYCDISEYEAVRNIIEKYQFDEFYNLAAESFVQTSFDHPFHVMNVNTIGHLNILESIRKYSKHTKIYFAASSEMYGKVQEIPQTENTSFYPRSPYGCFPEGTRIECLVKRRHKVKDINGVIDVKDVDMLGGKEINNLSTNDLVLSYNLKTGIKEFKKIKSIFCRDTKELYIIKLANGNYIKCTEEHPIFVHSKNWVEAKNLIIGDEIIQYKYSGLNRRIEGYYRIGKTNEEIYGKHKASEIKNKRRISFLNSQSFNTVDNKKEFKNAIIEDNVPEYQYKPRGKGKWKIKDTSKMCNRIPWNKGLTKETDVRLKRISDNSKINCCSTHPSIRKKISKTLKKLWKNEEYREKMLTTQNKKPNKTEEYLTYVFNCEFPDEFKYVGNRALFLGKPAKNPDWIHTSKNKVIEFFGRHWHEDSDEYTTIQHYNSCGYDCLIIWEEELKNISSVITKIKNFLYNKNTEVVKIVSIEKESYYGKVYNIEVEDNNNYFAYGVLVHNCSKLSSFWLTKNYRESYNMNCCSGILFNHESKLRGEEFVTRKITINLAKWFYDKSHTFQLGNLDAKRDWGFAGDYVLAQFLMLTNNPLYNDYVISSNETYSIREFIFNCCNYLNVDCYFEGKEENESVIIDGQKVITVSREFYRPAEIDILHGCSNKARKELGWKPEYNFKMLVDSMIQADIKRLEK